MPLNTAMAWSKINLYDEKEVMFSKQFYMRGEDDSKSTPVDDYLTLHTTINPKSEHVNPVALIIRPKQHGTSR